MDKEAEPESGRSSSKGMTPWGNLNTEARGESKRMLSSMIPLLSNTRIAVSVTARAGKIWSAF